MSYDVENNKVLIIAEAGVNAGNSLTLARGLALMAKQAGADMVKFQTAVPELVISRFAEKAEYQKRTTGEDESQLEMIKKLHLSFEEHRMLKEYCDGIGIAYLSTPFDLKSLEFLVTLNLPMYKIPSGEITNLPLLEAVAKTEKPIIMSTGMCTLEEISEAVKVIKAISSSKLTLLHCNTEYPTPFEDVNLKAMLTIAEKFNLDVGYSDHTRGLEAAVAAVALGATVIEKHFTYDKNAKGPDHAASLDPQELKQLVASIRNTEILLGKNDKTPSKSESKNIEIARKSIVASAKIKEGETLTTENITTKRPGNGISPMRWHEVLGSKAVKNFDEDEPIVL